MSSVRAEQSSRVTGLYGLSVMMLAAGGFWPVARLIQPAESGPVADKVSESDHKDRGTAPQSDEEEDRSTLKANRDLWYGADAKRRGTATRSRFVDQKGPGGGKWDDWPGPTSLTWRPTIGPACELGQRNVLHDWRGNGHSNSREYLTGMWAHGPPMA